MKCGSLFTGIEGLDMAVSEFFGAEIAWVSEVEKPLLDRYRVPNLGDVTKVDWSEVEPVDILCGGYPCQPFSAAGQRGGFDDPRDLWPSFARAVRILRPRYVVAENVAGHLQFGFERTLADLAEMGFDARWGVVRASETGAPHRRERVFLLAANTEGKQADPAESGRLLTQPPRSDRLVATDAGSATPRVGERRGSGQVDAARDQRFAPDTPGIDESRPIGERNGSQRSEAEARDFDWGAYGAAIRRWERVMGPAPLPVDDKKRLSPAFVEWMMGFPAGWTEGLTRTQALKALGNAVVPQQARLALELLS